MKTVRHMTALREGKVDEVWKVWRAANPFLSTTALNHTAVQWARGQVALLLPEGEKIEITPEKTLGSKS